MTVERAMKYGVVFPQTEFGNDIQAIKDYAQTAEGLGYDYLLVYDHVLGATLLNGRGEVLTFGGRGEERFALLDRVLVEHDLGHAVERRQLEHRVDQRLLDLVDQLAAGPQVDVLDPRDARGLRSRERPREARGRALPHPAPELRVQVVEVDPERTERVERERSHVVRVRHDPGRLLAGGQGPEARRERPRAVEKGRIRPARGGRPVPGGC